MREKDEAPPVIFWRIEEWFPDLDKPKVSALKTLHNVLIEICKTSSIISPKSLFVSDALYFADAIKSSEIIFKKNPGIKELFDLNQGHGFPTLVWAVLFPDIKFTFLNPDPRKSAFFVSAINILKLKNCSVSAKPLELHSDGEIQYIVHKGTLTLAMAALAARKVVPAGGAFFHLKGEEWGLEVAEMPTQLCSLWAPSLLGEYRLPIGNSKFSVIKSDKIA